MMLDRLMRSLVLVVLILSAAGARADEGEEAVVAALETFAAHLNAGEWDAALAMYAVDERFYWIERGRVAYPSREVLAEAFLGLGEAIEDSSIALSEHRVLMLPGGYAYASAHAQQRMAFGDGQAVEFAGAMSILLVETPDGWRFLAGHTSMEPPPGQ